MEHGRGSEFLMEPHHPNSSSSSFTSYSHSMRSGGGGIGGRGMQSKDFIRSRPRGRGNEGSGKDKIDALGRLLTRILGHMASELKLNMRGDGFVKVQDLLKLDMKTFANIPLRSHSIEDIREAVGKDNKQRFSFVEDGGELWTHSNGGMNYISDNKVIMTEGFNGVVPAKYFQKIESWPDKKPISL